MKKVIALKFADPLVKGLPLAYHLRISQTEMVRAISLLGVVHTFWTAMVRAISLLRVVHTFCSHEVPQNNVIFVHLHITLYTATLTASNCGRHIYF